MAELINLTEFKDSRGKLTVIEKVIPFDIKRVFYIHEVDKSTRGNHRHHKTIQAVICLNGSCWIGNDNGTLKQDFILNSKNKCLILYPEDFHWMYNFSNDAILLVLASEYFDPNDYIYEPYKNTI